MGGSTKAWVVVLTALIVSSESGFVIAFQNPSGRTRRIAWMYAVPRARQFNWAGAISVEWERVVDQLQQVDDDQSIHRDRDECRDNQQPFSNVDAVHRAIFCGYKSTKEDYCRLRSADPEELMSCSYPQPQRDFSEYSI